MGWQDAPEVGAGSGGAAWMAAPEVNTSGAMKKAPPKGRGKGGMMESMDAATRGLQSGALFNFDDEITAAWGGLWAAAINAIRGKGFHPIDAYNRILDRERSVDRYDEQNNGGARLFGQVAGGGMTGGRIAGRASQVAGKAVGAVARRVLPARVAASSRAAVRASGAVGAAAGAGATLGAVAGYGAGEGESGRIRGAAGGAMAGGALGGAAGGAISLAPRVAQLYNQFTLRLPVAEAVAQTMRALQRDGLTLSQARAALDNFQSMGKPAVLGDLGPNVRARAGVAARSPGSSQTLAREVLDRRQVGQGERLNADIRQTVSPRVDVRAADDELLAQARARAAPLYDEAYAARGVSSPEIDAMLGTPAGKAALAKARTIAANEGRDPTSMGFDLDQSGEVVLTRVPSPQTLDLVKRGFDDLLEPNRNPLTGRLELDASGNAINGLRARFLQEVDRLNPVYGQARGAYAGPAQARDALSDGRRFASLDPEDIAAKQARNGDVGRDMFRVGAARAMTDTVNKGKPWTNRANGIASTPQQLAQLRAMGANADELARRTAAERQLAQLNGELQGSQTDIRRLASQDAETAALPLSLPRDGWIGRGLMAVQNRVLGRRVEQLNDNIAPLLFGDRPEDVSMALQLMAQAEQRGLIGQASRRALSQRSGGRLGLLAAPAAAPKEPR